MEWVERDLLACQWTAEMPAARVGLVVDCGLKVELVTQPFISRFFADWIKPVFLKPGNFKRCGLQSPEFPASMLTENSRN